MGSEMCIRDRCYYCGVARSVSRASAAATAAPSRRATVPRPNISSTPSTPRTRQAPRTPPTRPAPPPAPPPAPSRDELKAQLEKLVLGKKWPQAAALVPLLEPFGVGDEVSSFYAAISAFEAGDVAKARTLAKPAVGKVMKTPFVEYYEKKILGTP